MIGNAQSIVEKLNTPGDWAIVGGCAVIGAAVDGAINIVPLPFFSPGVCALLFAGAALSLKRGVEASVELRHRSRLRSLLYQEAGRCAARLVELGRTEEAEDLAWQVEASEHNIFELEEVVRTARSALKGSTGSVTRGLDSPFRGTGWLSKKYPL